LGKDEKEGNYVIGLSAISNQFINSSTKAPISMDSLSSSIHSTKSMHNMVSLFKKWGIPLGDVCLFPHVDNGNGHLPGNSFLVGASATVTLKDRTKQRLTFAAFMQKVVEDALSRSVLTNKVIEHWKQAKTELIKSCVCTINRQFMESIWKSQNKSSNGLIFQLCHMNKTFYYSIYYSELYKVFNKHHMPLTRRIKAIACLPQCNGPDKFFLFLKHVASLDKLPDEVLPVLCNRFMLGIDGTLASKGRSIHHQTSFQMPMLKVSCLFGLRSLLQLVEGCNDGTLTYVQASVLLHKHVEKAGHLSGNHMLSLLVLTGIIWHHEFLTSCSLAPTLIKNTRE